MITTADIAQEHYPPLPKGWEVRKLKFVAHVRNSNVDKTVVDDEVQVALCNYTDVYYNDTINRDLPFMQGSATEAEIERFQLRQGQVILTKDSESWDDIAIPSYVPVDMPDVVCGYHLTVLTPDRAQLSGRYLSWLCRTESLNGQFKVAANGVTRYGLGQHAIKNAVVCLPPLDIQEKIADYLESETARVDGLICKMTGGSLNTATLRDLAKSDDLSLCGLLIEYREAVISAATTGQLQIGGKI